MRPIRPRAAPASRRLPQPDILAAEVLVFLSEDEERFGRFLADSGLAVVDLRAVGTTPAFAEALLDHLCADETLLVAFAGSHTYDPGAIERLRQSLGRSHEDR